MEGEAATERVFNAYGRRLNLVANNGGGKLILGATERESGVQGVWGGTRGWIPVDSHDDSTREGRTMATHMGPPDDWGGPGYTK